LEVNHQLISKALKILDHFR